ncbi:aminopeptidase N [Auraticoccus monumenti]|uniref:Aminopeptidase N n=1 Tax=Auraticoccus monumenti TaxID=675864 RepID=A0A1G7EUY2_9ACTN|nr:aminopeptidase N [Auraticoccus monumenti]SDE67402.1 Membrane alanyl aminopeptidase Metallo peptidase. MEROPS family M01 [Auraticoccus monumenti]
MEADSVFPDNLTRDEAAHRSSLVSTDSYQVLVDLSGRDHWGEALSEPDQVFTTTSTVRFTSQAGSTHIDAIAERIESATLDGRAVDTALFADSRLPLELTEGDHELTVVALHRYSRSGLGLHRFVDPADGLVYLYTQFEVSEARRMYACFEQPDLKATFELSVIAPSDWTVVSNAPAAQPERLDDALSRWDFTPTLRISTYITALVAGHYHRVVDTYSGPHGDVPLSLLCRRSVVPHLDTERLLSVTRAGFGVFEEHFGTPYPFGTYDQAFVPEYNMGAMENAGCVTLRDEYLFRSRVTQAAHTSRDNTILHELAHMWFGDLVTMTWWDDLWLNESFAEWASHFAQAEISDPVTPWATFCNSRKTWAYRQDQLPSTHPIAADMVDLEAVELNFDGITYAKGASALRQLVAFVGLEQFLTGVRAYFAEHAFGSTRLADLLSALTEASGRDLSDWSAQWLETSGVNTLSPRFETDDEGRFTSFAVAQDAPEQWPTLRSHRMAIGLYDLDGDRLTRTTRLEVDVVGALTEVPELVGRLQPDLVLLNDDDLTYAKVRLDPRSQQTLVEHVHHLESPLARAVCWGAAWDMCRDAELVADDYVELVLRGVGVESDLAAVQRTLGQAQAAVDLYAPRSSRDSLSRRLTAGLATLLVGAEPGSDHQLSLAQALARSVRTEVGAELLAGWLEGEEVPEGLVVDTDLRWLLLTHLCRLGHAGETAITAELHRDNTIAGAEKAAGARAARPDVEAKEAAWVLAVDDPDVPNETQHQICTRFWQVGQEELTTPYVDRYLQAVEDISASRGVWASKGLPLQNNVLEHLFPMTVADEDLVQRVEAWMGERQLSDPVRRVVGERLDDARRALRCRRAA